MKTNLDKRIKKIEKKIGQRIVIKGVREIDPDIKGRVVQKPGYVLLEYNDELPGFFWHFETIEKLLDLIERGERDTVLLRSPEVENRGGKGGWKNI